MNEKRNFIRDLRRREQENLDHVARLEKALSATKLDEISASNKLNSFVSFSALEFGDTGRSPCKDEMGGTHNHTHMNVHMPAPASGCPRVDQNEVTLPQIATLQKYVERLLSSIQETQAEIRHGHLSAIAAGSKIEREYRTLSQVADIVFARDEKSCVGNSTQRNGKPFACFVCHMSFTRW
jgi:hypothetical protein